MSRTPLREALLVLERDGLLTSEPHRGFSVTPRDEEVLRDLYPVIGALEALALRSGQPSDDELAEMRRLNDRMTATADPSHHGLDRRWHEIIAGAHANRALEGELDRLRRLARLHLPAGGHGPRHYDATVRDHAGILSDLRQGQVWRAASRLERHWVDAAGLNRSRAEEPVRRRPREQKLFGWLETFPPRRQLPGGTLSAEHTFEGWAPKRDQ